MIKTWAPPGRFCSRTPIWWSAAARTAGCMSRGGTTWASSRPIPTPRSCRAFQITEANIHGSPVFWNSPAGPQIYLMGEVDHLKAFRLTGNTFQTTPQSQSEVVAPPGMPGGFASLSANGSAAGTGIVWLTHPYDRNANWVTVPGVLRAYDAADLTHELWDSKMNAGRDDVGMFAKFCAPTVANGKVYVSTFSNQLQVYGLLDGILPAIDSVSATSAHLIVHFQKPVEAASATKTANYSLDNDARIQRASLDARRQNGVSGDHAAEVRRPVHAHPRRHSRPGQSQKCPAAGDPCLGSP